MRSSATDIPAPATQADADAASTRPRVVVIGYGNPLRADDGAGVAAADRLADRLDARGAADGDGTFTLDVLTAHQLLPEHAEVIAAADVAIFLDASCELPAGEVAWRELVGAPTPPAASLGHHLKPDTLIGYAEALYRRRPRAWVGAIGAASLELNPALTPVVDRAVETLVERVAGFIVTGAAALDAETTGQGAGHA